MATFAIGDVHGCFKTLDRLLGRLDFDQARDRLWLTGDLVNRGPDSLEVLRWARRTERELGDRFVAVLGNHDLHAIAVARGWSSARRKDTLDSLMAAADREELITWLVRRPLLYRDGRRVLVHAGVLPEWTVVDAEALARQLTECLQEPTAAERLLRRTGPDAKASGHSRRALAALTRLRALTPTGSFCRFTGPPEQTPVGCIPWFEHPRRRTVEPTFVVGHWAALGLRVQSGLVALDSGCTYGGSLSAVRLDDRAVFQEKNREL